jgi:sialate O-acetylesterase
MIGTSWGGTPAQAWTSMEALQAVPTLKAYAEQSANRRQNAEQENQNYQTVLIPKWKADVEAWKVEHKDQWDAYQTALQQFNAVTKAGQPAGQKPRDPTPMAPKDPAFNPNLASSLFNGMVAPIIPYGIKGAIWYQGEANAARPVEYATLLPTMIGDWRARWNQGDFPFLIVQLANYQAKKPDPSESSWAAQRESQAKTAALPHNGLALAIDIGETADIHPRDKDDVGARLVLAARKVAYGDEAVVFSGPTFSGMTVSGDKVRLTFDNIGSGLTLGVPPVHFHPGEARADASTLKGFAVAGADGKYVWADATIDGDAVTLSSPQVQQPVSVRYDWADNPDGNLYNKEGLPAVPFRTDKAPVGEAAAAKAMAATTPTPAPAK